MIPDIDAELSKLVEDVAEETLGDGLDFLKLRDNQSPSIRNNFLTAHIAQPFLGEKATFGFSLCSV